MRQEIEKKIETQFSTLHEKLVTELTFLSQGSIEGKESTPKNINRPINDVQTEIQVRMKELSNIPSLSHFYTDQLKRAEQIITSPEDHEDGAN